MVSLEAITPALYAFAEAFAQRVLSERKESLRQFLAQEELIYQTAFKFYVFALQIGMAREDSYLSFADHLCNNGILNGDKEGIKNLSRPVHDEYWRMAQSDSYWINGRFRSFEGIDKFSTVVGKWRESEKKRLEDRQELLNRLRSTLAG
ncbi:MAG TPA: hypothetical protein VF789_26500 [Thermoanaerobaculia bacterium]